MRLKDKIPEGYHSIKEYFDRFISTAMEARFGDLTGKYFMNRSWGEFTKYGEVKSVRYYIGTSRDYHDYTIEIHYTNLKGKDCKKSFKLDSYNSLYFFDDLDEMLLYKEVADDL